MGAAIPGRCAPAEAPNTARPPAMQGDGGNEVSQSGIGLSLPPASDGGRVGVILPSTSAKGGTAPAEIGFEQRGQRRSGGQGARLALVRAMASGPGVVESAGAGHAAAEIAALADKVGRTQIPAAHSPAPWIEPGWSGFSSRRRNNRRHLRCARKIAAASAEAQFPAALPKGPRICRCRDIRPHRARAWS